MNVDRRARSLMLRSFNSFAPFIEAVEYMVLHFVQVRFVAVLWQGLTVHDEGTRA